MNKQKLIVMVLVFLFGSVMVYHIFGTLIREEISQIEAHFKGDTNATR